MKKAIIAAAAVTMAVACMAAPSAVATPKGGYAVFAQCPTHTAHVNGCFYGSITGGYIAIGSTVVPLAKTVVLQAGMVKEGAYDGTEVKQLVAALDGETLTKVGQPVPGLSTDAVAELAVPASSITVSQHVEELALALPIKLRLVNPVLGSECSIGSSQNPIELNLTTGATGGGLTGNPGVTSDLEEGGILLKRGVSMVSSGFTVPKADGCGTAFVDNLLNALLGLPSSKNQAVLNLNMELASRALVEESEE
ncbi:MAG TPA: hypothetical protein VNV42_00060 [Solirubrobacteraceae bacterium]|jgi:hypothetical protein|nr:hypothetical protein [Solirubrobacteraceae bacterium]